MVAEIGQRAELTFRRNRHFGRHGWLRLTPAYSLEVVAELLAAHPEARRVLDPFSGSATTALAAAEQGRDALGIDINPFLVWLGNTKTARYTPATVSRLEQLSRQLLEELSRASGPLAAAPPIRNIERWWSPEQLRFLRRLSAAMDLLAEADEPALDLLRVAFCRTLIALSNAAFNHQSMSFKGEVGGAAEAGDFLEQLRGDLELVARTAAGAVPGRAEVIQGDARDLVAVVAEGGRFDLVVTSPPYPNRISYVRELRPYMYWLGYLVEAREAGELDWRAIGGTWGVASSRLKRWRPEAELELPDALARAVAAIEGSGEPNGPLLSAYVLRYFHDMWRHLGQVRGLVASGGALHYVVGNSSFYGHLVAVESILAEMMTRLGFEQVRTQVLRKRSSKRELFEFLVSARR